MRTLAEDQNSFLATIYHGPDALDPDLFAGPIKRVFLGLRAHANTISYNRLVALEDSFPRTRSAMGEAQFNQLSRDFCDGPAARSSATNSIGAAFPDFLRSCSIESDLIDLSRIEYAWLQCYHAPEAVALRLNDLAELDTARLLAFGIAQHPAMRCVHLTAKLSPELSELTADDKTTAILIVRQGTTPLMFPISALTAALADAAAQKNTTIGNLLNLALEQSDIDDPLAPVLELIGTGAIVATGT